MAVRDGRLASGLLEGSREEEEGHHLGAALIKKIKIRINKKIAVPI
jgi:hypothetical protein